MNAATIVSELLEDLQPGSLQPAPQQRVITIGTIMNALPPKASEQVMAAINDNVQDLMAMTEAIKAVLVPHASALETIGVDAHYAAYMITYAVSAEMGLQ